MADHSITVSVGVHNEAAVAGAAAIGKSDCVGSAAETAVVVSVGAGLTGVEAAETVACRSHVESVVAHAAVGAQEGVGVAA